MEGVSPPPDMRCAVAPGDTVVLHQTLRDLALARPGYYREQCVTAKPRGQRSYLVSGQTNTARPK